VFIAYRGKWPSGFLVTLDQADGSIHDSASVTRCTPGCEYDGGGGRAVIAAAADPTQPLQLMVRENGPYHENAPKLTFDLQPSPA